MDSTTPRRSVAAARLGQLLMLAAAAAWHAGCASARDPSARLSRVARDWCLAIRASQVIPVYPLTTDLRVGDVFLTTTALGDERALLDRRGFLPLQTHLARLPVLDEIAAFYARRPGDGAGFPEPASGWDGPPAAAFPAYTFDAARSDGLNLALPVHGVPAGLRLLGSGAARGTVTIADATTVGLDVRTLAPVLDAWRAESRGMLSAYASDDPDATPVYIRVVTRVYRATRLTVTLESRSGAAAAAAGGAPPELGGAALGGSAGIRSAAASSVSFDEVLPEPMVIGYLAYDCRVLPGGVLSAPVPTFARVSGMRIAEAGALDSAGLLTAWYTADERGRLPRLESWVREHFGDTPGGSFVAFMSLDQWEGHRRRAIEDLGVLPR